MPPATSCTIPAADVRYAIPIRQDSGKEGMDNQEAAIPVTVLPA